MRVAWRTVGGILERVAGEAVLQVDLLDGLQRIGIEAVPALLCVAPTLRATRWSSRIRFIRCMSSA